MTALKEYQRLEASGLWRPTAEDQRREVVVSVGEATLTISDLNDRPLTHWSLAALERINPGQRPAIYCPDGDPGETLELAAGEDQMTDAIERLRRAVERARPRPGRLRLVGVLAVSGAVLALLVLWLPGAMTRHAVEVVPTVKRQEIGQALLGRIERVAGGACGSPETRRILARLARRTGVRQIVVLPSGVPDALGLPGSVVVLNKALLADQDDPGVAAGFVLRAVAFGALAWTVPALLFAPGDPKPLLRRAVADWLPADVVARRDKKGFPTPLQWWAQRPALRELVLDLTVAGRGDADAGGGWSAPDGRSAGVVFAPEYLADATALQPSELWTVMSVNGWLSRLDHGAYASPRSGAALRAA